jgi:hypothetical protein
MRRTGSRFIGASRRPPPEAARGLDPLDRRRSVDAVRRHERDEPFTAETLSKSDALGRAERGEARRLMEPLLTSDLARYSDKYRTDHRPRGMYAPAR